ncbi:hypothetical protein B0H17DRAFT_1338434 [Mycena rosella]|uniref:Uncharacterized protein n=1 Tax=Mycena rosella TaxID=1033263 RepID=A0AAD7CMC5_MYCRO|nr:hypothetical protein B0H17DRAFT_1338434 [Mycena rosella]
MPTQTDSVCLIGIYKVPPHLSKGQFETKFEAFMDALFLLPVVNDGLLKYELLFQNATLDEHVQAPELPASRPTVVCRGEWEVSKPSTEEQVVAIAQDAKFKSLVAGEIEELGST